MYINLTISNIVFPALCRELAVHDRKLFLSPQNCFHQSVSNECNSCLHGFIYRTRTDVQDEKIEQIPVFARFFVLHLCVAAFHRNLDPELFCACRGEGSRALGNPGARFVSDWFQQKTIKVFLIGLFKFARERLNVRCVWRVSGFFP